MDSKEWETLVGLVRKQLSELRSAQSENVNAASTAKETLREAKQSVMELLEQPGNPGEAFYRLPLILHTLTNQKLVGVLLMGKEGNVVMHHVSGQRLLGIDPITNALPTECFFDNGALVHDDQLPWRRCLRGEELADSVALVMKDKDTSEELHLEVDAIPLRNGSDISGAITLFREKTEIVKAGRFISDLCSTLEKQLTGIESAQRELTLLSNKLPDGSELAAPSAKAPVGSVIAPSSKKVLIVDDIPVNQKLLLMRLRKYGVEAEVADNGEEAVTCCKRERYALVFMDVDMPVLNGYEATAEIRKFESEKGFHTPIVALTSFDRDGDRQQCFEKGMDDFVSKGDQQGRVRDLVDRYIFEKSSDAFTGHRPYDGPSGDALKLDQEWLQQTFGDDTDHVVGLFFGSAAMLLNCLEFALKEEDLREVTHFAFSLKGPCSTIGANVMAEKAGELVKDAEQGKWLEAIRKYSLLRQMFRQYQQKMPTKASQRPPTITQE